MALSPDVRTSAQQYLRAMLSRLNLTLSDWHAYRNFSGNVLDDLAGGGGGGGDGRTWRVDTCGGGVRWLRDTYRPVHGYLALAVCCCGLVANALNVLVLTRREMRSPTNAILTGLAVSDGIVMLEYMPFALLHYVLASSYSTFTYWTALYVLFHAHFAQIFHTVSIFLTVLLAVWRYLLVVGPGARAKRCAVRRTAAAIAAVYALSPLVCVPSYFTFTLHSRLAGPSGEALYSIGISETARLHHGLLNRANFWLYSVLIKLAPCLALTYFSVRLMGVLAETRRRKRRLLSGSRTGAGGGGGGGSAVSGRRLSRGLRHTDRTAGLLAAALLLFLLTELPQAALAALSGALHERFFRTCYQHFGELLDMLALCNSAVNFLLYCLMCKQFRTTFWSLLGRRPACCRPPAPPQLLLLNSRVISAHKEAGMKTTLV